MTPGTSELPPDVADEEPIIRGICSPYHISKGKLKFQAYDAPPGSDEVSVMRLDWLGADGCKRKAKQLENLKNPENKKIYSGLAVLSAKQIRDSGASVVDSRHVYKGHADIKHGVIREKGIPPSPEVIEKLRTRNKMLASLAQYYPDPLPDSEGWSGLPLLYKAHSQADM